MWAKEGVALSVLLKTKRPIQLGSYISGSLLGDKQAAITLCEVGLQANPHDASLLNNIVYSIATSDNLDLLDTYVPQMLAIDTDRLKDDSKITYQATLGLVALKRGDVELGKSLYESAINNASRIKNEYLKNLAIVNYTRELSRMKLPEKDDMMEKVKIMSVKDNQKDLELLRNEILGET